MASVEALVYMHKVRIFGVSWARILRVEDGSGEQIAESAAKEES